MFGKAVDAYDFVCSDFVIVFLDILFFCNVDCRLFFCFCVSGILRFVSVLCFCLLL